VGQQDAKIGVVRGAVAIDIAHTILASAVPVAQQNAQISVVHTAVGIQVPVRREQYIVNSVNVQPRTDVVDALYAYPQLRDIIEQGIPVSRYIPR